MVRSKRATNPIITRARELRREMTVPERMLWAHLRRRPDIGGRFRRQHPVGPYVVDFACLGKSLAIEIDGRSHEGHRQEDASRQRHIEQAGFRVLRFTNDQVIHQMPAVLASIERAISDPL